MAQQILDAVREFDRLLRIYPQFGEPIIDLTYHSGTVRLGVVIPLVARYAVLEEQRLVLVASPFLTVAVCGF